MRRSTAGEKRKRCIFSTPVLAATVASSRLSTQLGDGPRGVRQLVAAGGSRGHRAKKSAIRQNIAFCGQKPEVLRSFRKRPGPCPVRRRPKPCKTVQNRPPRPRHRLTHAAAYRANVHCNTVIYRHSCSSAPRTLRAVAPRCAPGTASPGGRGHGLGSKDAHRADYTPNRARLVSRSRTTKSRILKKPRKTSQKYLRSARIAVRASKSTVPAGLRARDI